MTTREVRDNDDTEDGPEPIYAVPPVYPEADGEGGTVYKVGDNEFTTLAEAEEFAQDSYDEAVGTNESVDEEDDGGRSRKKDNA